jgi:hypothetical protein
MNNAEQIVKNVRKVGRVKKKRKEKKSGRSNNKMQRFESTLGNGKITRVYRMCLVAPAFAVALRDTAFAQVELLRVFRGL